MIITQPPNNINPPPSNMPPVPKGMIHHKGSPLHRNIVHYIQGEGVMVRYGVSSASKALSPGSFFRDYDRIRRCLLSVLGLSIAKREVVLRLLRLYAYYGNVYPKEKQITSDPGCSKATYWRTIKLLSDQGLLTVVNRYVRREKAQISNLYLLDKLILLIVVYLQEHGIRPTLRVFKQFFSWPGSVFWSFIHNPQAQFHINPVVYH